MGGVNTKEEWRAVPGHPRYELSNQGRLRGPRSQVSPRIRHSNRPASAMYPLPVGNSRCTALMIKRAMKNIWGVDFEPTAEWVASIRAEVVEMRETQKIEADEARRIERLTLKRQTPRRFCKDCGRPLFDGYWWRCPACWDKIRA